MSKKVPPDKGGRKQATGGAAGKTPEGPSGTAPSGGAHSAPRAGYGREGGNAGTHPRNKKPWEKP